MSNDPAYRQFAKLSRQARAEIARVVRAHGRSPNLAGRIRAILDRYEPRLAAELRGAQVWGFVRSAQRIVNKAAVRSDREPPQFRRQFTSPADRGVTWPQVVRAVESIAEKVPVLASEFEQLDDDARRVAFTVARATTLDTVRAIQDAIREDVSSGGTLDEFRRTVAKTVDGSLLADHHVEQIYRTNVGRAMAAGQIAVLEHPQVRSAFPYVLYSATHDSRVRADHLALEKLGLDGTAVYRADDPIWNRYYPPWAFNSVVPETIVQGAVQFASKAGYAGKVLQLTTQSGRRTTVTPDHPVLTRFGFVPAKSLTKGMDLLGYRNPVGFDLSPKDNVDHPPTPIGQVFDSLRGFSGCVTIKTEPLDFHSHTEGRYSDIEVVAVNRHLLDRFKAGFADRIESVEFPSANLGEPMLTTQGAFSQSLGAELLSAVGFPHFRKMGRNPVALKSVQTRIGSAANLYPSRYETGTDRTTADAVLFGELQFRHPSEVFPDKLLDIKVQHYSGPVYDVQTESGYMVADGIVESNCRCVVIPLSVEDAAGYGVREAKEWIRSGTPPLVPEWVRDPGFALPDGWIPSGRRLVPVG